MMNSATGMVREKSNYIESPSVHRFTNIKAIKLPTNEMDIKKWNN